MAVILVVDDEASIRSIIARVLKRAGHSVEEAPDGVEAINVVRKKPVDLLITDIQMPRMDGRALILEFRKHHPDVPVIAISGGGGMSPPTAMLEQAEALGAAAVMAKPFKVAELLTVVGRVLVRE